MTGGTSIVCFRRDLRVGDNPALHAAVSRGAVVPVFIWAPEEEGNWPLGGASRWWLHQSLIALDAELRGMGSRLIVRAGRTIAVLREIIRETGSNAVFWNRRYEPDILKRDADLEKALRAAGLHVETFDGNLLFEPGTILTRGGEPFQVFTPFWKACLRAEVRPPVPAPQTLKAPARWPRTDAIELLGLEPEVDWAAGLRASWEPGHVGGKKQLDRFFRRGLSHYDDRRDRVDLDGSSRLSPHLAFGEIGVRQLWHAVRKRARHCETAAERFLTEVGWHEFAYHVLVRFPEMTSRPLRREFDGFPWARSRANLSKWQEGRTGYPIVDAAMRHLWHAGWMPNRARMIVASFLTKHLLIPWQKGAAWFWDTLVDADLANNSFGWQWTAGCGADAAPYFRIFNPVSQAEKFDPEGSYIRRWVPEIARLAVPWIFKPWEAPDEVLETAGVSLGSTYPNPIVDHAEARTAALAAYERIRKTPPRTASRAARSRRRTSGKREITPRSPARRRKV